MESYLESNQLMLRVYTRVTWALPASRLQHTSLGT